MKTDEVREHLPLSPAVFHVLMCLAEGHKHGYGIIKEVEAKTDGRVALSTGTLYGIIKRLLRDGWIEEHLERPRRVLDDPRRRYYRLTPLGRSVAAAEAERLEQLVSLARRSDLLGGPQHA